MERAFLSTNKTNSKGKKLANTAQLRSAKATHDEWLKSKGLHKIQQANQFNIIFSIKKVEIINR